jgi:hypothetical protein
MSRRIRDAASIPSLCARSGNTNIETAAAIAPPRRGAGADRRYRRVFAERAANQEHQHGRERRTRKLAERGRKRQGRDRESERQGLPERRHFMNRQTVRAA